jgi:hypothetical protein
MIDPGWYMLLGWLGIAWGLDWARFFHGPQGQTLEGHERILSCLCWPYVLVVMFLVLAIVGSFMGVMWIKGRMKW